MGDFLYLYGMETINKPWGYWTIEKCVQEIIDNNYVYKKDFRNKSPKAYDAALRNGWMKNIEKHFNPLGNKFFRGVYRYIFSDGCTYSGLTDNFERRHNEHMMRGPVYQHMITTGLTPEKIIVSDYVDSNIATYIEINDWDYLVGQGYKPLQPRPQQQLGGTDTKWTIDVAKTIVKDLESVSEFRDKYNSLYSTASQNGWLKELSVGLKRGKVDRTKEECINEIKTKGYKTKSELFKGSPNVYHCLNRNNWWDEVSEMFFQKNVGMKAVLNTQTGVYYTSVKEACESQNKYISSTFKNHLNPKRNRGVNNTPFIIVD